MDPKKRLQLDVESDLSAFTPEGSLELSTFEWPRTRRSWSQRHQGVPDSPSESEISMEISQAIKCSDYSSKINNFRKISNLKSPLNSLSTSAGFKLCAKESSSSVPSSTHAECGSTSHSISTKPRFTKGSEASSTASLVSRGGSKLRKTSTTYVIFEDTTVSSDFATTTDTSEYESSNRISSSSKSCSSSIQCQNTTTYSSTGTYRSPSTSSYQSHMISSIDTPFDGPTCSSGRKKVTCPHCGKKDFPFYRRRKDVAAPKMGLFWILNFLPCCLVPFMRSSKSGQIYAFCTSCKQLIRDFNINVISKQLLPQDRTQRQ